MRSLACKLKWTTICFMQIEDYIVQNYRENGWIRHWNSLGKKQFFLAVAETVVSGKQCSHWTPLMSILFALQHIKPQIFPKWAKTKAKQRKNDLIWIEVTSFIYNSHTSEDEWMLLCLGAKLCMKATTNNMWSSRSRTGADRSHQSSHLL